MIIFKLVTSHLVHYHFIHGHPIWSIPTWSIDLNIHYGCYFYMCQASLRYVSQNGLLIKLRENKDFAENFCLRCISALFQRNKIPLLINLIDEVHPCQEEFKRYFNNNWLPKASMISCFERIMRRTNNPSEG